ncbi:MAG: cytidine deaminase [Candidatus Woesebacteria bacterium]|nr:MAG: cytidine deaminase [Candidatus Woesebacteria bacterium]
MHESIQLTIDFEKFDSIEELPQDEQLLITSAREAMNNAHSPYSHFTVGAALGMKNGDIVIGSNQENAAYGSTICAERSALVAAGSLGRKEDIRKLAVIGTSKDFQTSAPVTPCGACRQVIKEYEDLSGEPLVILITGETGPIHRFVGIESLLPFAFGPKDLNK